MAVFSIPWLSGLTKDTLTWGGLSESGEYPAWAQISECLLPVAGAGWAVWTCSGGMALLEGACPREQARGSEATLSSWPRSASCLWFKTGALSFPGLATHVCSAIMEHQVKQSLPCIHCLGHSVLLQQET